MNLSDLSDSYYNQLKQTGVCMLSNYKQKQDTHKFLKQISFQLKKWSDTTKATSTLQHVNNNNDVRGS